MKCSKCGSEMKVKDVRVDTDVFGKPIYKKYACCYNCKTKYTLDRTESSASSSRRLAARKRKKRKQKKIILLAASLIGLVFIVGVSVFLMRDKKTTGKSENAVIEDVRRNKISAKAFAKMETGMLERDVVDIIGNEGNKLMQMTTEESVVERYQWSAEKGDGTVLLTFKDDKLISISQVGMTSGGKILITDEMVSAVKAEMSYEEVMHVMGTSGTLMSETVTDGVTTELYSWMDESTGLSVSVVFSNDKVKFVTDGRIQK